jgi:hypothetical protein
VDREIYAAKIGRDRKARLLQRIFQGEKPLSKAPLCQVPKLLMEEPMEEPMDCSGEAKGVRVLTARAAGSLTAKASLVSPSISEIFFETDKFFPTHEWRDENESKQHWSKAQ